MLTFLPYSLYLLQKILVRIAPISIFSIPQDLFISGLKDQHILQICGVQLYFMDSTKKEMGMAKAMGPQLLNKVGKHLLSDLGNYGILDSAGLQISWNESEGEGNWAQYLDGEIENYAYLTILDANFQAIGQGSMEFIIDEDEELFLVYWNSLYFIHPEFKGKVIPGIPDHVWNEIPKRSRKLYESQRVKKETPPKFVQL